MDFYNSWKFENKFCELCDSSAGQFCVRAKWEWIQEIESKTEFLAFGNLEKWNSK